MSKTITVACLSLEKGLVLDIELQKKLSQMIMTERVASLGTLHGEFPLVSMVLYVASNDLLSYYFQASRLTQHTQDFLDNNQVGLLIREPDTQSGNPQLLARISILGTVEEIISGTSSFSMVRDTYLKKFPNASITLQLPDFSFYAIRFIKARYIAGFGKAFNLQIGDMRSTAQASDLANDI